MKRYGRVGLSGKERVREEALFGSGNTSVEFILSDEKKIRKSSIEHENNDSMRDAIRGM
jgi:hypothetical protein